MQQLIKDSFNGKDPNRGIHADEAVAYGSAVQAIFLTPLTLGVELSEV